MNDHQLRREISLPGAVMLGLGSIVGTGVFVSIGVAAGVAGANVLPAIFIAALVAICNGLSSAQLAAVHPVSGGTYEYGHRWLTPWAGFLAGWLFLCAKSASAATAALGLAGYLHSVIGSDGFELGYARSVGTALTALAIMTFIVIVGIKRTSLANTLIVSVTLASLLVFVVGGLSTATANASGNLRGLFSLNDGGAKNLLQAAALMFVAYTGYGRIATMGEEVAEPRRTIPRAMIVTLALTMVLYLSVGFVAVAIAGPQNLSAGHEQSGSWAAPLLGAARQTNVPMVASILTFGAITAMLGVMLNLLLGLSRVVLAMSRRSDMPSYFSAINSHGVPLRATLLIAVIIGGLVCIGDVRLSWSFSAVTVLIYYALTNLCALRVSPADRIFPAWPAWCGLLSCLSLAFFVEPRIIIASLIVIAIGFVWRAIMHSRANA